MAKVATCWVDGGVCPEFTQGWGGVGIGWEVGWGNTNPTSCYAGDSSSTRLHELDGVGMGWHGGWGGVGWGNTNPTSCYAT